MIKMNFKEYAQAVFELNLYKNKKVFYVCLVSVLVIGFFINYLIYRDLKVAFMVAVGSAIFFIIFYRLFLKKTTHTVNNIKNLACVEQIILEDKIIERTIKQNNTQTITELKFRDIYKLVEDKNNLYLYINRQFAMILVKSKINNIEELKQIINKNNLEKSI